MLLLFLWGHERLNLGWLWRVLCKLGSLIAHCDALDPVVAKFHLLGADVVILTCSLGWVNKLIHWQLRLALRYFEKTVARTRHMTGVFSGSVQRHRIVNTAFFSGRLIIDVDSVQGRRGLLTK